MQRNGIQRSTNLWDALRLDTVTNFLINALWIARDLLVSLASNKIAVLTRNDVNSIQPVKIHSSELFLLDNYINIGISLNLSIFIVELLFGKDIKRVFNTFCNRNANKYYKIF